MPKSRIPKAVAQELAELRRFKAVAEQAFQALYDALYFDPDLDAYDPNKENDSAADFMEMTADELRNIYPDPQQGAKEMPAAVLNADMAECQDCGHIEPIANLNAVVDLDQRVLPGERVPDGQCTKCGAVSHRLDAVPA